MLFKIFLLLLIVGVLFGWDKIISLVKAFVKAKKEFKSALEEDEDEKEKKKVVIKVVEKKDKE